MNNMLEILEAQRSYFRSGVTRDIAFRKKMLSRLYKALEENESSLKEAVFADLGKPAFEAYATETGLCLNEIRIHLAKLKSWSKKRRVPVNLVNLPATSYIQPIPYGQTLIFSAWNYPIQLLFLPLVSALAAGNTAILKPSELAPEVSKLSKKLIENTFPENYVYVVEGGKETAGALLSMPFDFIFFTGSTRVGKIVMEAAAKNLTPVCLELGGKNPCIVDETANIDLAARRICWGKSINSGQTCVAPDYLLVHEQVEAELIGKIRFYFKKFYGEYPLQSKDLVPVANNKAFERLLEMTREGELLTGGKFNSDKRLMELCLLKNLPENALAMQDEIFGPVLPVFTFHSLSEVEYKINQYPKPLAMYLFSRKRETINYLVEKIPSGGCAINETVMHMVNHHLPFGGMNQSGIGAYHGKHGFDVFSHKKAVLKKPSFGDIPLRYPPYSTQSLGWIKKILH